jgi:hypothetical protein
MTYLRLLEADANGPRLDAERPARAILEPKKNCPGVRKARAEVTLESNRRKNS